VTRQARQPSRFQGKKRIWRQALLAGSRYVLRPGCQTVAHFATDFAPCGCVTHQLAGVPATSVDWYTDPESRRYMLRCLHCNAEWSRANLTGPPRRARTRAHLYLDVTHPEERAARRERGR
jgi:hypothetical protein